MCHYNDNHVNVHNDNDGDDDGDGDDTKVDAANDGDGDGSKVKEDLLDTGISHIELAHGVLLVRVAEVHKHLAE